MSRCTLIFTEAITSSLYTKHNSALVIIRQHQLYFICMMAPPKEIFIAKLWYWFHFYLKKNRPSLTTCSNSSRLSFCSAYQTQHIQKPVWNVCRYEVELLKKGHSSAQFKSVLSEVLIFILKLRSTPCTVLFSKSPLVQMCCDFRIYKAIFPCHNTSLMRENSALFCAVRYWWDDMPRAEIPSCQSFTHIEAERMNSWWELNQICMCFARKEVELTS